MFRTLARFYSSTILMFKHFPLPLLPALVAALLIGSCGVNDPEPKPPIARFSPGCMTMVDSLVEFTNMSLGSTGYEWDLGNGERSTEQFPKTRYTSVGEYQVRLVAVNSSGDRDTITKTITIFPPPPLSKTLDIPFILQGSTNWLWAAISEMILKHEGVDKNQCEILNQYFRTNCCNSPLDCVVPGSLRQIELDLERLGNLQSEHQFSPLTLQQIRNEIAQNRPVVAGYEQVGASHAVMIVGYNEIGEIIVYDPIISNYSIPYTKALRYADNSYLEWTESIYCIRK